MPDYFQKLMSFNSVTLKQAVTAITEDLLCPHQWVDGETYRAAFSHKYYSIYGNAANHIKEGQLEVIDLRTEWVEDYDSESGQYYEYERVLDHTVLSPKHFLEWAMSNGQRKEVFIKVGLSNGSNQLGTQTQSIEELLPDNVKEKIKGYLEPELRKKVVELTNEKDKWDASLKAAAKIGILFLSQNIAPPKSFDEFKCLFKEYIDKKLPDTAIKKIYDGLPTEQRNLGGQAQQPVEDLDVVIKAAVFAGSQAGVRESMNLTSLKKSMKLEQIALPADEVLEKIIGFVKKLDLDE